MTLPAAFPLAMPQIASEIGLALPISLNHPWIILLAGKAALPVSFSDLLGKTGRFDGAPLSGGGGGGINVSLGQAPWFGGQLSNLGTNALGPQTSLTFFTGGGLLPNWNGNIRVTNNTLGASVVLTKFSASQWAAPSVGVLRSGFADSLTILPSA